jgi:hypothetical protein
MGFTYRGKSWLENLAKSSWIHVNDELLFIVSSFGTLLAASEDSESTGTETFSAFETKLKENDIKSDQSDLSSYPSGSLVKLAE